MGVGGLASGFGPTRDAISRSGWAVDSIEPRKVSLALPINPATGEPFVTQHQSVAAVGRTLDPGISQLTGRGRDRSNPGQGRSPRLNQGGNPGQPLPQQLLAEPSWSVPAVLWTPVVTPSTATQNAASYAGYQQL